ncbi:transcription initiation factor TFIID subunit 3 [Cylas formicarius]|uniref:transcription initiation factor TFIID subunit 3 n=1 Tax=Cylas formicarius TaxID=197179 RepID=UPI00295885BF|nr:transcription initiation factor TFIID subunit 3 [Cylas formicarius]
MSAQYTRDHCKLAVAKILQTIGWHSINSTPLEVLTDIMANYIRQLAKITNDYSNEFGQTDANLDHLGLAFQEMGLNISEIEEYVTFVNFMPPPATVPKYPLPKESNLNFLKPGSKEVVTRPIYINEHLPPMYPLLEEPESDPSSQAVKKEPVVDESPEFKKPADFSANPEFKRPKREEEGSRPTREISSVMMTTSGFLSPAREGKLPEAKAPAPLPEPVKPPSPAPPPAEAVIVKKKVEKKKDKLPRELFKPLGDEKPVKRNSGKDGPKGKQKINPMHVGGVQPISVHPQLVMNPHHHSVPPMPPVSKVDVSKQIFNKTLAAAKAKTEKLNTTITPIPIKTETAQFQMPMHTQIDKLFNEPDKKKINILKKISNVKDKPSRPTAIPHVHDPNDIVNKINLSGDITIEPINPLPLKHSPKVECYFDNGSPPVTPPTPRTPELLKHSPPLVKERRKRKDKARVKKLRKQPNFLDADLVNLALDQRPKTPEPHMLARQAGHFNSMGGPPMPFPFPLANFGGPGLIPPPLGTHLFPFSSLSNFSKNNYFNPIPPQMEPVPKLSPKAKPAPKAEPAEIVPIPPTQAPAKPEPPLEPAVLMDVEAAEPVPEFSKRSKDHKKEKKEKIKKKNKKEKVKDKIEKKKIKEAKKVKDKIKKEKKKKEPKEGEIPIPKILLKVNSPSPRPETPETMKKLNIKPIIKKEDESTSFERKREPSPGLAKISALVTGPPKQKNPSPVQHSVPAEVLPAPATMPRPPGRPRIHPLKPKPLPKPKKVEQPFVKKDADGNEVWICPACGQQDDGRPMIGCDGCDAWYHWVCVGIQVPPDENENWYCKPCLCKKNEDLQDKKKKRKKKEKKEH